MTHFNFRFIYLKETEGRLNRFQQSANLELELKHIADTIVMENSYRYTLQFLRKLDFFQGLKSEPCQTSKMECFANTING